MRERLIIESDGSRAVQEVQETLGPLRVLQQGRLTEQRCLRLARLVQRIEWALGEGQDPYTVAWASDGNDFWIESVMPADRPKRPVAWSNANLSDAVAGVPTPITWSFVAPFLKLIMFAPLARLGYRAPSQLDVVRLFDGRAYLDLTSLQTSFYLALGAPPADVSRGLGAPPLALDLPSPTLHLQVRWSAARTKLFVLMVRHPRSYADAIRGMREAARAIGRDFTTMTDADLSLLAERIARAQTAFGPEFQFGNFAAGIWSDLLRQTIMQALPERGEPLAAALMAGTGGVVSAEQGYRLYDLARLDGTAYRTARQRFLDDFGHRGVYEAELSNPRWIEDPSFIDDQVARVRAWPGDDPRGIGARIRRDAEREVDGLPWARRGPIRWLAARARRAAAQREAGKSALIAMALPVRGILLEFGRRMADRGVLERVDDIFYLTRPDLEAFVLGEWDGTGARALVAERRALRSKRLAADPPPDLIVEGQATSKPPQGVTTPVLKGLAASGGRARGHARIVLHPEQAQHLLPGDILVARSTDPGWTPLFPRAAALVTELGGYLSHSAIVARELGLPAVVGVTGAMSRLRDGDLVTVDGNAGTITPA